MARTSTPIKRKRARPEIDTDTAETPSASSLKKRRLDDVVASPKTPDTPSVVKALASKRTRALGFGPRSASRHSRAAENDKSYDVPDSEEEAASAPRRQASAKAKGQGKDAESSQEVYTVPESSDELATTQTAKKQGTGTRGSKSSLAAKSNGQISTPRRRRTAVEEDANDEEDDEPAAEESPSKLQSIRKARRQASADVEPSENEGPDAQHLTQTPSKQSGRKKRDPLADLVIDGTPRLKGILTPSRRDRDQVRPKKNVAFDSSDKNGTEEVFFEDLPSKRTPAAKPTPVAKTIKSPSGRALKVRDVDEDDEVCVICAKPDSKPPNEIIFCDHCDSAYHQECCGVSELPEGDWLCKNCTQDEITEDVVRSQGVTSTILGTEDAAPDIPNFEQHLRCLQRVLLDRCTGRRRVPLRDQDEAYEKTFQLVEQTVMAGEGNSMLVIGARGCGKTTMVESVLSDIAKDNKDNFHVVRLNGFIHTDDKLALKGIWRQLGKEMEVEDELISKTNNYADTLASLLALLSHPSEISGAEQGVTSRSVVFVIDEFDLFATHARQTLLYNLFDIAQARKAPIAVIGVTTRIDVVESLEKRVKSRFSHRYVYLSLPKSLPAYWELCKQGLLVEARDQEDEGIDVSRKGQSEFDAWWGDMIETLRKDAAFAEHLEYHYYSSKSVPAFWTSCIMALAVLSAGKPRLQIPPLGKTSLSSGAQLLLLEAPASKLHLLADLSMLEVALLIAAARLDIVAHTDTVNFAMAYDEYAGLMGRQRLQSASAGMLAVGGAARVWGRGVAGMAWERLARLGLLIPVGAGGGAGAGMGSSSSSSAGAAAGGMHHGGLEGRMWKLDVALEDIPDGVKLSAVMARWCREI